MISPIVTASRLSVCLFVHPSEMLKYCDHTGWNSSKIILWLVSLGVCSLQTQHHTVVTIESLYETAIALSKVLSTTPYDLPFPQNAVTNASLVICRLQ